jgi:hypothetical protein
MKGKKDAMSGINSTVLDVVLILLVWKAQVLAKEILPPGDLG